MPAGFDRAGSTRTLDHAAFVSARANGKVILLGEHAVVYGSPAIALGLTSGAEACVRHAECSTLSIGTGERLTSSDRPVGEEPVALRALRELLASLDAPPVEAKTVLAIPAGAGLGASAALGVALARAVTALSGSLAAGSIGRAALAWENVFHGNASGIDTAAAEHGGCLWFTRQGGVSPLRLGSSLQVVVALVEPGASTRLMVEAVAERRRQDPEGVGRVMAAIAGLVEAARQALAAGASGELGSLMLRNQELLVELGVSTPGLDRACGLALGQGALGAKLTGAGGGGCVIALVDGESRTRVLDAWQRVGFSCLEAKAGPDASSALG